MLYFRKLARNWQWVLINILGLSLAFACVVLVFSYTIQELSFDQSHAKANRIYRVTTSKEQANSMHPARVWGNWIPKLKEDYPAVEDYVRMVPFKKGVVEIEEQRFYSNNLFKVDSSFFSIYDFPLISGERTRVLTKPNQAVVTESLAQKYFGSLDVLGKRIKITHQQQDKPTEYMVVGILEDMPATSHFHADILTSIPAVEVNDSWGYTYYLLKSGTNANELASLIQEQWDSELEVGQLKTKIHFQKLTDIHLYSHKTREIEPNGDVRSLILLSTGAFVILFIALINFLNLSRVQFIADKKALQIRLINGASKKDLIKETLLHSCFVSLTSLSLGLLLAWELNGYLLVNVFTSPITVLLISLIFVLAISILSVVPLLTTPITANLKEHSSGYSLYVFPLVLQFSLAVIALAGSIVLQKQMHFLNSQHPQANNESMLVIEQNPWNVVQRYDQFRNELLKYPSIKQFTGAMEPPAGDILDNYVFSMDGINPEENNNIYILTTGPNFFTSMGIEPIAGSVELGYTPDQVWESKAIELSELGRNRSEDQERMNALYQDLQGYSEKYILNESALKMLGIENAQDVIGRSFSVQSSMYYLFPAGIIVAVVPDFHYTNLHSDERPTVIVSKRVFSHNFLIEIDSERKEAALSAIQRVWKEVNPEYPLEYEFISNSYKKVYAKEYAQTKVLSLFTLISVLLAALGVYALSTFSIQRRTKEIGIRKVNGASILEIMLLLNKKFLVWMTIAFVIAVPLAWYAMQLWLNNFAYKTPLSWWIFLLAGAIALFITLLTVSIQSYRAAIKNPVDSIRYE